MRGASLDRKTNTRGTSPRILVVTEGEKTEPQYLLKLAQDLRVSMYLRILPSDGSAPSSIVDYAQQIFLFGEKGRGRHRALPKSYDEVYMLFDRDEHTSYKAALQKVKDIAPNLKNNFKKRIIFEALPSNPCFELWFVLHYQEVTNLPERNDLFEKLKAKWDRYEKNDPTIYERTKEFIDEACKRAHAMNKKSSPYSNERAYTGVVTLVDRLKELASGSQK